MTDLRTRPNARPQPICHPGRPHKARRLCPGCYEHHMRGGTLHQAPRTSRTHDEVIPIYVELRAAGHTVRYVAWQLGMTLEALNKHYYRAVRAGLLTPDRGPA